MNVFKKTYNRTFKYWFTPFYLIGGGYIIYLYLTSLKEQSIAPLIYFALGMGFSTVLSLWFPDKKEDTK